MVSVYLIIYDFPLFGSYLLVLVLATLTFFGVACLPDQDRDWVEEFK